MKHNITFKKASKDYEETIFSWLNEPHMIEFWDNSKEHKDDILNFIYGRKQTYLVGTTKYFVGLINDVPFSFLLGDLSKESDDLPLVTKKHISKNGHTIWVDFGIGNKNFLGKKLAAPTLEKFVSYYRNTIDTKADTFFIDPDENNSRAKHVYEKTGFSHVGEYLPKEGAFIGHKNLLMVKKNEKGN